MIRDDLKLLFVSSAFRDWYLQHAWARSDGVGGGPALGGRTHPYLHLTRPLISLCCR